jgi:cyclopropane fatty-acyl-phospholipid synthase-like methyltransferase
MFLDTIGWELAYLIWPPWNIKGPPRELVRAINSGGLNPERSIDIGCGRGYTVEYLAKLGVDAWGIDISTIAIRQALSRVNKNGVTAKFVKGDIFEFKPAGYYDLVTDKGCYHTLPVHKRRIYPYLIRKRYLKSGGDLLLWVISDEEPDWGGPNRISKAEIEENFIDRGYKPIVFQRIKWESFKNPYGYFIWFKMT